MQSVGQQRVSTAAALHHTLKPVLQSHPSNLNLPKDRVAFGSSRAHGPIGTECARWAARSAARGVGFDPKG